MLVLQPPEPLLLTLRQAAGDRATLGAPCAVTSAGARSARRAAEPVGLSWLLGHVAGRRATARGPASPASRGPWADLRPNTMRRFKIIFQLFLILEIVSNFQNSYKLVGVSKKYKINFV
jgi:hypothetical protein